jgi:hypothetical protein
MKARSDMPHIVRNDLGIFRHEIRRGKGNMGIFGDIGLAFVVLLFAFGMADFISRG